MSFFLNSVATIGFNPAKYSVAEDAGSTVSVQNGTLARRASVVLETSFTDGSAATGGILFVTFIIIHG